MTEPKPKFEVRPRWFNRIQSAAYLGVSTSTFKKEQEAGLWPGPSRVSGKWQLWDRAGLDEFSSRISGFPTGTPDEEIGDGRDRGSIKRRIDEFFGDQEHPAPRRSADRE